MLPWELKSFYSTKIAWKCEILSILGRDKMERIEQIYEKLTGVNIEKQDMLFDERGKGYYGEFLVLQELYRNVKGNCKILMNLQIPTETGKTTEIDLLLIHETGIYVFEVKHYRGTIYGKTSDRRWTQYFRTASNSYFNNPVNQNKYHVNALKRLFPHIPIFSYIVFTNDECELRVENDTNRIIEDSYNVVVCQLRELIYLFENDIRRDTEFSFEQINALFGELLPFSPTMNTKVEVDGEKWVFHEYINNIVVEYQKALSEQQNKIKKYKFNTIKSIFLTGLVFICLCVLCIVCVRSYITSAEKRVEAFLNKFEIVEPNKKENLALQKDFLIAEEVILQPSKDLENTTNLSCKFVWNGDEYKIKFANSTVILVLLKDGTLKQYDFFGSNNIYQVTDEVLLGQRGYSTTYKLQLFELQGIEPDAIDYIKLSNITVFKTEKYKVKEVVSDFEIEVYKAQ